MVITLNIGLNVSNNYRPEGVAKMQLQYKYVRNYLEQVLGTPSCIGLARSATEKTVVAQYDADVKEVLSKLFWLARQFNQDCIAYAIQADGVVLGGALVGEYAHEWNHGVFNADYFIEATTKLHYRTGLPI